MDEGTRVGVGEAKGEGVTEMALPTAVGFGTGMMGFRYRCLIPTNSRIAAHNRKMSSTTRCQRRRFSECVSNSGF